MRPVRFVALSEDGQALVLADEVGRLLALPIDERVNSAVRQERIAHHGPAALAVEVAPALSPRDIQARIRAGESAEEVARIAGVPVDRVLRYAGPVLQERAMLAQHARRTRLRNSDRGETLAQVIDARLAQHAVDTEKVSWDAYRREDGTWRVIATWPSGKATAQAVWELDKARQVVSAHDDMAQFLSAERPTPLLGQEPPSEPVRPGRDLPRHGHEPGRSGHEPIRPTRDLGPARAVGRDPLRRDALRAALERPLDEPANRPSAVPGGLGGESGAPRPAAASANSAAPGFGTATDDDGDPKEIPAVPSLAVLRSRRTEQGQQTAEQPRQVPAAERSRLPSWDDVLFGGGPRS